MRNARNALLVVIALAGVSAFAAGSGIEVLSVSGIEVLRVDTRSWDFPAGSSVWAVVYPDGVNRVVVDVEPVNPATGLATVVFPFNHPTCCVELRSPSGELLGKDCEWGLQVD